MLRRSFYYATALTSLAVFAACSDGNTPDEDEPSAGKGGTTAAGAGGSNTGGTGGAQAGSGSSGGGTGGAGGSTGGAGGVGGSTGGASGAGGVGGSTGGVGGSTGGAGGSTGGTAGTGGSVAGSGGSTAGMGGGGAGGAGGSTGGSAGAAAGSGPDVDQNGKMNAPPGSMTSTPQDYLRLGEVRILNNNWGSEALGCNTPMSVFINQDRTFGWTFNRGNCDTVPTNANPDFPQLEFGIHPFGIGSADATSPDFSSTTLLPIQIKDVMSATVAIQNLNATFQQESSWNITFEFWISQRNPVTDPNPGVHAELMTFWGWQNGRWPDAPMGNGAGNEVQSGGKTYRLWVQDDAWAGGKWRYFQFRDNGGPSKSFNGTLDVKPFIDYLVNSRQYSTDFWLTRLEVGSEIDDMTQGTVQMSGVTFTVNGQSRAAIIGGT